VLHGDDGMPTAVTQALKVTSNSCC
jgi:hypothetical protein